MITKPGRLYLQLREFSRISSTIIQEEKLEGICTQIATAIREYSPFDRVLISLIDENSNMRRVAHAGLTQQDLEVLAQRELTQDEKEGIFQDQFKVGNSYYIPHNSRDWMGDGLKSRRSIKEMVDWHPDDYLFIPLYGKGQRVIGLISVDDPRDGRAPTEESLIPLELFACQAARAIEEARLKKKLKESEEKYRALFEHTGTAVAVIDENQNIFMVNRRFEELSGFSRDEIIKKRRLTYFLKENNIKDFNKHIEVNFIKKYVEIRRVEIDFQCIPGTARIIAVINDITERKRLESQVSKRAERIALLNVINQKISSTVELNGVLMAVIAGMLELSEGDSCSLVLYDEKKGKLTQCVSMGLHDEFKRRLKWRARSGGITNWVLRNKSMLIIPDTTLDPRSKDSRGTKLEKIRAVMAVPILSKGKILGIIYVNSYRPRDFISDMIDLLSNLVNQAATAIEKAKLYQKILDEAKESAALYEVSKVLISNVKVEDILQRVLLVLQNSLDYPHCAFLFFDRDTGELYVKTAMGYLRQDIQRVRVKVGKEGITGWVAETGEPLNVPDVLGDPRYIRGVKEARSEIAVPLKVEGQVIGVLDVQSPIVKAFGDRDLRLLTSVAAQVAIALEKMRLFEESKKAYEELKATQVQLIQSAKLAAVGELAAGVAHELNNPIGGILGYAQYILEKAKSNDIYNKDIEKYLYYIEKESHRCKDIVQNLLSFSREDKVTFGMVNINEVLEATCLFMNHQLSLSNIELIKRLQGEVPWIMGNSNQLQQVFTNLILNAQQAMSAGGRITILTRKRGETVIVKLADTGCGIIPENMNKIFDPFFTTKKVGEGTGLGLSVSYGIIKEHGGDIRVTSRTGKGTIFTISFPVGEVSVERRGR